MDNKDLLYLNGVFQIGFSLFLIAYLVALYYKICNLKEKDNKRCCTDLDLIDSTTICLIYAVGASVWTTDYDFKDFKEYKLAEEKITYDRQWLSRIGETNLYFSWAHLFFSV